MNIVNQKSTYKIKLKKCCTSKELSHFQGRWELNPEEECFVRVFCYTSQCASVMYFHAEEEVAFGVYTQHLNLKNCCKSGSSTLLPWTPA